MIQQVTTIVSNKAHHYKNEINKLQPQCCPHMIYFACISAYQSQCCHCCYRHTICKSKTMTNQYINNTGIRCLCKCPF